MDTAAFYDALLEELEREFDALIADEPSAVKPEDARASVHRAEDRVTQINARRALATVDHEHGIPGPLDVEHFPEADVTFRGADYWHRIQERLRARGFDVLYEPTNRAVTAWYEN